MNRQQVKNEPGSADFHCPVSIGDVSATLTTQQIYRGIMQGNPAEEITITFPSAVELIQKAPKIPIAGFVIRFSIRNDGRGVINLAAGEGGNTNGVMAIRPSPDAARFIIRYASVTSGMESYTLVRE